MLPEAADAAVAGAALGTEVATGAEVRRSRGRRGGSCAGGEQHRKRNHQTKPQSKAFHLFLLEKNLLTAVGRVIARQRIEFRAKSRGLQIIEQR